MGKYSKETKLKAVKLYLEDGISSTRIAKMLNLSDHKRALLWVKQYRDKGETAFDQDNRGLKRGIGKGRPKKTFRTIEEEVIYLRLENEFLKKLEALNGK